MTPLEYALEYIRRGWSPIPIPYREKGPILPNWPSLRVDAESAGQFFDGPRMNIGVILGPASNGLTDVDLDCPEARHLSRYLLPGTRAHFGRRSTPTSHVLYRTRLADAGASKISFADPVASANGHKATLVEILIGGGEKGSQAVFPGSCHRDTGETIEWVEFGDPSEVDGDELKRRVAAVAALSLLARYWPAEGQRQSGALVLGGFLSRCGLPRVAETVGIIAEIAGDDEVRKRVKAAEDAAAEYERGGKACGLPKLREIFGTDVTKCVAEWLEYEQGGGPGASEDDLALKFADRHEQTLRYVAHWGRWLHYDGKRWAHEHTLLAYDLARDICREEAASAASAKQADAIKRANTVAAVERLARADRRIAGRSDQWDADPWLLNTPNGVIDLRSGSIRPHSQLDYMTKITAVAPGGICPTWREHLLRVMNHKVELVAYLQRVFGYGLTGITREHALFFAYGTGANGKSVTINTVLGIMGDYQRSASMETFTVAKYDRHPTELAGLQGARLVSATETEESKHWAESRIKMLTGGDKVEARFMRQDFFEYTPQFKLFISGNHKPRLRSVDEATSRRFQIIPFDVTIPPLDRDHSLPEKLKSEWPGILAWMIEGCLLWQRDGLNPPEAVRASTSTYLDEEDLVLRWFDECCEADTSARTASSELHQSFVSWATRTREFPLSQKAFSERLAARAVRLGLLKGSDRKGAYFQGLRMREEEDAPF
jgi:P4 family phage/plasmid primase-like protien